MLGPSFIGYHATCAPQPFILNFLVVEYQYNWEAFRRSLWSWLCLSWKIFWHWGIAKY